MCIFYIPTVTKGGRQYRQLDQPLWDKKTKRSRTHVLQHLGPVFPVYDRRTTPVTLPLDPPSFGLLATQIMMGSLTAAQVIDIIHEMGREIPPGDLVAVGICYDLGGKDLRHLLWLAPPSAHTLLLHLSSSPVPLRDPLFPPRHALGESAVEPYCLRLSSRAPRGSWGLSPLRLLKQTLIYTPHIRGSVAE